MKLTISQIDKILWQGEAQSVSVPGADGELTILSHHMPLISTLHSGTITVTPHDGAPQKFPITSGFLEVGKNETVVLV